MKYDCLDELEPTFASHLGLDFDENIVIEIEEQLRNSKSLTLPLETELSLLHELTKFELGKFLLQNKGLNGYWTRYIIIGDHSNVKEGSLEDWILTQGPVVCATQQRFAIFQQETNKLLTSGMTLASIPCGLMDDLLSLNYAEKENIKLVGIDLDLESINLAKNNIEKYNKNVSTELKLENAWDLSASEEYDLISSNGLNIYEPNDERVIKLYQEFYDALRPNGYLVTSFLTPPPVLNPDSPWREFSMENVIKQKAIFSDILQAKWQVFRTEAQVRNQLEQVGFKVLNVIYDKQAMFPTIIAQKE